MSLNGLELSAGKVATEGLFTRGGGACFSGTSAGVDAERSFLAPLSKSPIFNVGGVAGFELLQAALKSLSSPLRLSPHKMEVKGCWGASFSAIGATLSKKTCPIFISPCAPADHGCSGSLSRKRRCDKSQAFGWPATSISKLSVSHSRPVFQGLERKRPCTESRTRPAF